MTIRTPAREVMPLTAPAAEAISIDDARNQMRVTHIDDDFMISQLISEARKSFETNTGHAVMRSTWRQTMDCFPEKIRLLMPPIISVESIKYYDTAGVQQTLDPSVWRLVIKSNKTAFIELKINQSWPVTMKAGDAVTIDFTAGYADENAVPANIKRWLKVTITDFYNRPESVTDGQTGKIEIGQDIAEFIDWTR